jgi:hypothetical protein
MYDGGIEGAQDLSYCEMYECKENKWREMPSMIYAHSSGAAVVIGSKYIYAFGGYFQVKITSISNKLERLLLARPHLQCKEKWVEIKCANAKQKFEYINMAVLPSDKVLIFGNHDYNTYELALKPVCKLRNTFIQMPDKTSFYYNGPPVIQGKFIYVFNPFNDLFIYDIKVGVWKMRKRDTFHFYP